MVAPGMLQNPSVRNWLGGVEPAWTLLHIDSFVALHRPPSPTTGPIRLASDLTEIRQSAVARNALVLLRAAAAGPGGGLQVALPRTKELRSLGRDAEDVRVDRFWEHGVPCHLFMDALDELVP